MPKFCDAITLFLSVKRKKFFISLTVLLSLINMNKDKVSAITCLLIFVLAVGSLLFLNNAHINKIAFAVGKKSKFNEGDFKIKNFGVGNDGNPYLTVDGIPGRSIPQKDNLGYAYVFVTDNGIYAVTSDWMYPQWHAHKITLDQNNCVGSINMKGGAEVGDMVKVTKTDETKVDKVITEEFIVNNLDGSICPAVIFDSAP
jgi:hypothetical protein